MQITLVRTVLVLVVDFFTVFLVVGLVLETANTVEKLFPHLNEE